METTGHDRWAKLVMLLVFSLTACSPQDADGPTTTLPVGDTSTSTTTMLPLVSTTDPGTTTTADVEPSPAGALLVVGDWGSGTLPQGAVAGAMMRYAEQNEVTAILTTGDNFYDDDVEFLMEPYGWALDAGIPFWVTWGDHDIETPERADLVEETFGDTPRWTVYEWGPVDVVILDSTDPNDSEQTEFLSETLAASEDPTIVVTHHPPYGCSDAGSSEAVRPWIEHFDDDVLLVLSGHAHNYQRLEQSGVTYVITGGGGAVLTELDGCETDGPTPEVALSTHHFLVMELSQILAIEALDVNGQTIDQFTVNLP